IRPRECAHDASDRRSGSACRSAASAWFYPASGTNSERSVVHERSSYSGRCDSGSSCCLAWAASPASAFPHYWPDDSGDFPPAAVFLPAWPAVLRRVHEPADSLAVSLTALAVWPAASQAVFPDLVESSEKQPMPAGHARTRDLQQMRLREKR